MPYKSGEASLTDKVVTLLTDLQKRGLPIYFEHRSGSGGYSYKKGSPDLFIVIDGTHIECELKDVTGKRSPMQDKFKYRCEAVWKIPYLCPHTFEEFKEAIRGYLPADCSI